MHTTVHTVKFEQYLIWILECYPKKLLIPKLFRIVLGPYRMRSSCNHPDVLMAPLRSSSIIFENNFDSPKVFSQDFVQIFWGLSTDVSLTFVPGIVRFPL